MTLTLTIHARSQCRKWVGWLLIIHIKNNIWWNFWTVNKNPMIFPAINWNVRARECMQVWSIASLFPFIQTHRIYENIRKREREVEGKRILLPFVKLKLIDYHSLVYQILMCEIFWDVAQDAYGNTNNINHKFCSLLNAPNFLFHNILEVKERESRFRLLLAMLYFSQRCR